MKKTEIIRKTLWPSVFLLVLSVALSCVKTDALLPDPGRHSVGQMPDFPLEITYERFDRHHVFLKKKGVQTIEDHPLVVYQVYKITSKDGFIYKEPNQLTMYVDPENKKVKYFCKNKQETTNIMQLVNPTVDSFGLEKALGIKIKEDFPDNGSFLVNGNTKIYFQRVGSAFIEKKVLEGFAIVKAVDIEGEPYLLSDILTLYVNPENAETKYFSQLCDPCNARPQKLALETEFSIHLQKAIMQWRKENTDKD